MNFIKVQVFNFYTEQYESYNLCESDFYFNDLNNEMIHINNQLCFVKSSYLATGDIIPGKCLRWHQSQKKAYLCGVQFTEKNSSNRTYYYWSYSPPRLLSTVKIKTPYGIKEVKMVALINASTPSQDRNEAMEKATKVLRVVEEEEFENWDKYNITLKASENAQKESSLTKVQSEIAKICGYPIIKCNYLCDNGKEFTSKDYYYHIKNPVFGLNQFNYGLIQPNNKIVKFEIVNTKDYEDKVHNLPKELKAIEARHVSAIHDIKICKEIKNYGLRSFGAVKELTAKIDNYINKNNNIEENNDMMNTNSIFKKFNFGKFTSNKLRFSPAGIAFLSPGNGYITYDIDTNTATDVSDMVFDIDCLYCFPTAIKDIKKNDVIEHCGSYVLVKEVSEDGVIKAVNPYASQLVDIMPVKNIFGFNYVTKIVNIFGDNKLFTPTEDKPFGDFSKLLPFMMMSEKSDSKDFMSMLLMMNAFGGEANFGEMNPMMLAMLMARD